MRSSALSHVVLPLRSAAPYSVTIKLVAILGVVTMAPGGSTGEMSDSTLPSGVVLVEGVHRKLWPPSDWYAPSTKSSCPPVPLIC